MEEICYFSTVRRISSFTGWNRIFGGWETDKATQNIEIHSSFVAFLGFAIWRKSAARRKTFITTPPFGLREITHVAPEKAIFVEDFRVSGAPVGGGAIDASRGTVDSTVRDSYLTRLRGALECCASAGAAADLVGLRPFRREAR